MSAVGPPLEPAGRVRRWRLASTACIATTLSPNHAGARPGPGCGMLVAALPGVRGTADVTARTSRKRPLPPGRRRPTYWVRGGAVFSRPVALTRRPGHERGGWRFYSPRDRQGGCHARLDRPGGRQPATRRRAVGGLPRLMCKLRSSASLCVPHCRLAARHRLAMSLRSSDCVTLAAGPTAPVANLNTGSIPVRSGCATQFHVCRVAPSRAALGWPLISPDRPEGGWPRLRAGPTRLGSNRRHSMVRPSDRCVSSVLWLGRVDSSQSGRLSVQTDEKCLTPQIKGDTAIRAGPRQVSSLTVPQWAVAVPGCSRTILQERAARPSPPGIQQDSLVVKKQPLRRAQPTRLG